MALIVKVATTLALLSRTIPATSCDGGLGACDLRHEETSLLQLKSIVTQAGERLEQEAQEVLDSTEVTELATVPGLDMLHKALHKKALHKQELRTLPESVVLDEEEGQRSKQRAVLPPFPNLLDEAIPTQARKAARKSDAAPKLEDILSKAFDSHGRGAPELEVISKALDNQKLQVLDKVLEKVLGNVPREAAAERATRTAGNDILFEESFKPAAVAGPAAGAAPAAVAAPAAEVKVAVASSSAASNPFVAAVAAESAMYQTRVAAQRAAYDNYTKIQMNAYHVRLAERQQAYVDVANAQQDAFAARVQSVA